MEHRHIPAAKDGSIPDAKTRFRRGQECDTFVTEKVTHKSANNRIGI